MNYNEFQETLLKELESRLDSHISLNPITTTKNNNTLKHGIEFSNDTSNISPVLYLDEWYEFYLAGKSLSQIAEDIVELYHQAADVFFTDTEMLLDYEKLQEKIFSEADKDSEKIDSSSTASDRPTPEKSAENLKEPDVSDSFPEYNTEF